MGLDLNRFRKSRPSEWVEWLADDPLPTRPQPVAPVQPQVHRPAAYAPVQRSVTQIPVQDVHASPARPMAPPGLAQPIQPVAPPVSQPVRPAPVIRPVQPVQPVASARPASMARPLQPIQPVAPPAPVSRQAQPSVIQPNANTAAPAVSIQISMPKFTLPKLPALPYRRIGYWAGGVAVVGIVTMGGWSVYQHYGNKSEVAVKGASTIHASPTFDTLAPQDKPQLGEGTDPASTAYDGKRDLYTFKDTLMGFPLVVSQQPLPANIKNDSSQLKKVADNLGGTTVTTAETAYGTVYIVSTDRGNTQRVVFAYKDVMVFVQSYKPFDADTWKYYVETLRQ